ncbi:lycopene cyclase family protein [Gramella lutea]|uniref:Lycopene cyclase family protein n=1 Tax=Christiangramia lutea TaxID=1607951 RepID=A0A9X2A9K7_9FLAO|nr:lycopene cyclase family protein [Christiangramia lutea]MCH4823435.1 lycopene cyclase family protein [Christiangramia lutea]
MITPDYFYAIVGGGLAGLQLAYSISNDVFFKGKKIVIIDPSDKSKNDKTWCFWENGKGNWDHLIHKSWSKAEFISSGAKETLNLEPYSYKMLRSLDFYRFIREKLEKSEHVTFAKDEIEKIDQVTRTAIGKKRNYTATHFFDSRPPEHYLKDTKSTKIFQHFKGWKIKTKNEKFDDRNFTMMDYRIKYQNSTSFTYVLPVSKNEALVEFTFFTPFTVEDDEYDKYLQRYISDILKIEDYKVIESEKGLIPMTDYSFHKQNTEYITKIGTAGGWVKASSGYSFKNTEKKIDLLIDNIKSGLVPSHKLQNKKFRKYDAIFLDVLEKRNDLGEEVFTKLYTKNTIQDIFRFLDEETKISEELKIMKSLFHPQFLKSFFKKI